MSAVNLTHPAHTEGTQDFVRPETITGGQHHLGENYTPGGWNPPRQLSLIRPQEPDVFTSRVAPAAPDQAAHSKPVRAFLSRHAATLDSRAILAQHRLPQPGKDALI